MVPRERKEIASIVYKGPIEQSHHLKQRLLTNTAVFCPNTRTSTKQFFNYHRGNLDPNIISK